MHKILLVAALVAASMGSAEAVVIVNGVNGEDADGLPPFRTIQAALDYANNNGDPVVDIQTTRPNFQGASLRGKELKLPITIQNSSATTITTGLDLLPTTGTHLITLKNLNVRVTGLNTPLIIGTSINAENCIFDNNPSPGAYGPAVSAAVESNTTTATVTMTSCTMRGHFGLQTGRAAQTYNLTRCIAIGQPTDLAPLFSQGINNNMNWFSNYTFRMGAANGYQEIAEPRTLILNECIVRGGAPLAWPTRTLDANFHYVNENSTIGPVIATNTVFDALIGNGPGEANMINFPTLPPNQNANSTFRHCTFRSNNAFGLLYFTGGQPTTYTFTNTLFDMMNGNYGILMENAAVPNVTFAGDANTYHVPAATEILPTRPPFEATKHFYIGNSAQEANITNDMGSLIRVHEDIVAEAVLTVPPTAVDKDGNSRPLPVTALASDIGADEIDESAPASVRDWSVY